MKLNKSILDEALELQASLIEWRRIFHSHPETGLDVRHTAATIRTLLLDWDIEILDDCPVNSVIARIPGNPDGAPIALRADMDALEIPEANRISYCSTREGVMHACGHDGHMSMLLGAAKLLSAKKLPQDTYMVFQPGEEGPGGALPIMQSGLLSEVRGIFAVHLDPSLPTGTVAVNEGRAMASTDNFFITVKGKGGHAGLPHQSVDPIAITAQIINSFQFIVSRLIDPVHPAVITLGSIEGGTRPNAIAEDVRLSGTIRTFSEEIREQIRAEIKETLDMFCRRYRGNYNLDIQPEYPPVINNKEMAAFIINQAGQFDGCTVPLWLEEPRMTAEDFSYYLKEIPGVFYWLGCRGGDDSSYPLHHSRFNMDESVLPLGAAMHAISALLYNTPSPSGRGRLHSRAVNEAYDQGD